MRLDVPNIAAMVFLEMFFEEGHRRELFVYLARLPPDFDEALELSQPLECITTGLADMEDVCEHGVRDDFSVYFVIGNELVHNDDVLESDLNGTRCTLQIGQLLFLLITRIL
jgi:hypothetical protein